MGYTTKFDGRFTIEPKLEMDQYHELSGLAGGEAKEGPGGYCQWVPTSDGCGLEWDHGEKFYKYVEWLEHIRKKLAGWGLKLEGRVEYQGEDIRDHGWLIVEGGLVRVEKIAPGDALEQCRIALRAIKQYPSDARHIATEALRLYGADPK